MKTVLEILEIFINVTLLGYRQGFRNVENIDQFIKYKGYN